MAASGVSSLLFVGEGCGSDDSGGGGGGGSGACGADITSNHGHTLSVSQADVTAGVDKTYNIQGGAPHDHTVTLTAAHFASLAQGKSVSVTSSSAAAHDHSVTVTCA